MSSFPFVLDRRQVGFGPTEALTGGYAQKVGVPMRIPFVDLQAQYLAHRSDIDDAIRSVIADSAFIGGRFVSQFEKEFATTVGVSNCVGCANGTDAIYIVLKMLRIGAGDEVITTASSWISTSETVTQAGAEVRFVDVDEYYGLDVGQVEAAITPRTRAVIAVHLYGQPAGVDALTRLCEKKGLLLIEDCAQAHLAQLNDRPVATFGIAGTFSFYPGKNLGAYGDAGAIVTNDAGLAERCRRFANHGALVKHAHDVEGINSRLDGLQAAILSAKLPYLTSWTERRRRVAAWYDAHLASIAEIATPRVRAGAKHVYHLYVVQARERTELRSWLAERGVESAVHYPTALPLLPAYARLGHTARDFPHAASNQENILSLPIYAEMSEGMVEYVADAVRRFYRRPG
jgi:dTDP-4-amino-4,6-dideoxygalactose transaminase